MNPILTLFPVVIGLALSLAAAAGRADNEQSDGSQDSAYGLALYQYYQDRPLAAITEINVGKYRHTLAQQQAEAELLLGGLYFSYGLIDESAQIFNGLLSSESEPSLRNRVWYNLARVNYQRGLPNEAETLLRRIDDDLPWPHNNHRRYIETALLITSDRLDEAERSLDDIEHDSPLHRYADYNLSLRRLSLDDPAGIIGMQGIARKDSPQADMQSLSDQANLTLGIRAFSARSWDDALDHLSQVRLDGPVASEALLATGWVHQRAGQLSQALAYWKQLLRLQRGDNASREAAYAIAFSLEQSGLERRALRAYQKAAADLDAQRADFDAIAKRIDQGALIDALDPDNNASNVPSPGDPIQELDAGLRKALNDLLASSELEQQLRRLRDLREIERSLQQWQEQIPVLGLMQQARSQAFETRAPTLLQSTDLQQIDQLGAARDKLAAKLQTIEDNNDYLALANEDEQDALDQIDFSLGIIDSIGDRQHLQQQRQQLDLLRGLVSYRVAIDHPRRLWRVKHALNQLDQELESARHAAVALKTASAAQRQLLARLQQQIEAEQQSIDSSLSRTRELLQAQRQDITSLALRHLQTHDAHIANIRLHTQYALTRLYDKLATTEQSAQ